MLYELLKDKRQGPLGPAKWCGNQRWIAAEMQESLDYTYRTYPINEEEAEQTSGGLRSGQRNMFRIHHESPAGLRAYTYLPDGVQAETDDFSFSQMFPWGNYGSLMEWTKVESARGFKIHIDHTLSNAGAREDDIQLLQDRYVLKDGPYYLTFRYEGVSKVERTEKGFILHIGESHGKVRLAVAFHIDAWLSEQQAHDLLIHSDHVLNESKHFWEAYLQSCPVHHFAEDYVYWNDYEQEKKIFNKETLLVRQLWHWWAVLVNVSDIEFNTHTPLMSPDRNCWHGTWSNDGPESLCALVLTGQRELARRCIVQYIKTSINEQGDLGWYTHSYGLSCLGHERDSGYYSHGVPCIVHAVEFYVRNTGDSTILDEDAGHNMSIWDKIKRYMVRVFEARDPNGDGLIEWANLWETGWDDKISPFFALSHLQEWVQIISENDAIKVAALYKDKQYPITSIVEQVYVLWALKSMMKLAESREDVVFEQACGERFKHILHVIEQRHWNSKEGFYTDWDVRNKKLSDAKNLDGFYYLYFADNRERVVRVMESLERREAFGLMYPPTLSADHPKHNPRGYWTGSYWPREMLYLGLALNRQGYKELALREVLKALCSQEGCVITEHMDPRDGEQVCSVYTMAYCGGLNIALNEIMTDKEIW